MIVLEVLLLPVRMIGGTKTGLKDEFIAICVQNMFERLGFFCIIMSNFLCLMSLSFIDISLFTFLDVISCLLCVLFSASWDFHYANARLPDTTHRFVWQKDCCRSLIGGRCEAPENLHGIKTHIPTCFHCFHSRRVPVLIIFDSI